MTGDCSLYFSAIALVVLTTLAGYAIAPAPFSSTILLCGCLGTALCSAAANTFNQVKYFV